MSDLRISVALSFFAPLLSFSLPSILMRIMATKKTCERTSRVLDACISATAGMALAHWMLRIVPFARILNTLVAIVVPIDSSLAILGFFFWHILDVILNAMKLEEKLNPQKLVPWTVPWSSGGKYEVRPMSQVAYLELWYLGSVHAAMEGFNIAMTKDSKGHRYASAVVHQMLLAAILGVSALRTRFSSLALVATAVLFAVGMPVGMLCGTVVTAFSHGQRVIHATWALVMCASSGPHLAVISSYLLLPEVKAKSKVKTYRVGLGVWFWVIVAYPLFDL